MWNEFDRGKLTDEEIIQNMIQIDPSQEAGIREFFTHLGNIVEDFPYSRDWIRDMKAEGYKVFLLSNFGNTAFRECPKNGNLQFVQDVDGKVISFEEKMIKPNADIFHVLLKKYNLIAEECLFFDDLPANIEGAKACGLNGVVFENVDQAREALKQFQ